MARHLEAMACQLGFEFILGFPNQNSFLPWVRLAGWRLIDEARFAEGDVADSGYIDFLRAQAQKAFLTERLMLWRLTRFPYTIRAGCVFKEYRGEWNLLDLLHTEPEQRFQGVFPFWTSFGTCPYHVRDDYVVRMAWLPLETPLGAEGLKRSVLFSDVF